VLAAGTVAQTSQAAAYSGLAVLAPVLRDRYQLSVTEVGVVLGGASVGAVLTLLPWGLLADRIGERTTATIGLLGSGAGFAGAAFAPRFSTLVLLLAIGSAFGASSNSATGRAVTSWFPRPGAASRSASARRRSRSADSQRRSRSRRLPTPVARAQHF
jgi:MFS family permease